MPLIAFIIVFLVYASIVGHGNASKRTYRRMHDEAAKDAEEFWAKYCVNENTYKTVLHKIPRTEEGQRIKKKIEDFVGIEATPTMIAWMYLAEKGRVPKLFLMANGTPMHYFYDSIFAPKNYSYIDGCGIYTCKYKHEELMQFQHKYLLLYDSTLKANGVEESIYVALAHSYKDKNGYSYNMAYIKDAVEITSFNRSFASPPIYFWYPLRKTPNHLLP